MALVNQVKKVVRMELWDIIKFQIQIHCNLNKISITDQNVECLTLLALTGEMELGAFCNKTAELSIFKNAQSARAALPVLEKKGLIYTFKQGKDKKRIKLHKDLIVLNKGNILLDYKIARVESTTA